MGPFYFPEKAFIIKLKAAMVMLAQKDSNV